MSLRSKLKRRRRRARYIKRWLRGTTGKRHRRLWERLVAQRRAIHKLKRLIKDSRGDLESVNVSTSNWSGSGSVMEQYVEPFMTARGLPIGSGKRTPAQNAAVGGSPSSDHLTTNTGSAARDFPTYAGEDDARALAASLGNHNWYANSYNTFTIYVDGYVFTVQILWGSGIGHGDHVHVGIRRVW